MKLGLKEFWNNLYESEKRYRYRQVIGGAFIASLVVFARPGWFGFALGTGLYILGAAIRFWASGYLDKDGVLETRGPYVFVRHPQYLGNCLIACGFCFASGHLWALGVVVIFYYLLYVPAIKHEDRRLSRHFRKSWEEWYAKTPAIVPIRWPSINPCLRLRDWSFHQSLRNTEPLWVFLFLSGLLSIYVRLG